MTADRKPVPKGLAAPGRRLWRAIVDVWELDEHELALLLELCRITDRLDRLAAVVQRDGEIIAGLHGPRANPALVEARQQAVAAARITAALRLPDGDEADARRSQRRVGFRRPYLLGAS